MLDLFCLLAAYSFNLLGFTFLSLSLERHWRDITQKYQIKNNKKIFTQCSGYLFIGCSCCFAVYRDGPAMGTILWICLLALGGTNLAFVLAWRSQWLLPLALAIYRRKF